MPIPLSDPASVHMPEVSVPTILAMEVSMNAHVNFDSAVFRLRFTYSGDAGEEHFAFN